MKIYISIIAASLFLIVTCNAQNQSKNYDDLYYSAKDKKSDDHSFIVKPQKVEPSQAVPAEEPEPVVDPSVQYTDEELAQAQAADDSSRYESPDGNTYITNNYYGDDYYDYAYSARLKRFHSNAYHHSYYSDYYTNMYWYDYDPWNWGISIYMGYNWWYPSYYSRWYWPYHSWGYHDWWSPYSYYGYGGYGYYHGYWHGYYDGYWNGYYGNYWGGNYYYNSYDDNSHYYGHRRGVGGSGGISGSNRRDQSFGERYENQMALERGNSGRRTGDDNNALASVRRTSSENPSSLNAGTGRTRNTANGVTLKNSVRNLETGNTNPGRFARNSDVTGEGNSQPGMRNSGLITPGNNQSPAQGTRIRNSGTPGAQEPKTDVRTQRPPRYTYQGSRTNPSGQGIRNQGNVQPYSSPSYTKPRSSQEYTAPKYRNTAPSGTGRNTYQAPSQQEKRISSPPGNAEPKQTQPYSNPNRNNNTYSAPRRTGENRSTPQRSTYSTPGRSNESYSAPRQNNSYSQPSRSSNYSPSRSSNSSSSSPSRSSGSSSSPSRGSSSGSGHRK